MRPIDADALEDKVADLYSEGEEATEGDKVVNDVIDLIDNAPTIETDMSEYSDKLWQKAYERGKAEAITNEDIKSAIHEGFKNGYEMAKAKYSPKTGHWISISGTNISKCSECQVRQILYDMQGDNFCPNCGANMRGKENECKNNT